MVKLLLTSTGFTNPNIGKRFATMLVKKPAKARVLLIPTAAYGSDCDQAVLGFVGASIKQLVDLGVRPEHLVIFDAENPPKRKQLIDIDVVYVCGGNTFFLLQKLRETKFDRIIRRLVKKGAIYVGVSAGSILPGPNINVAVPFDANGDLKDGDTTGLKLTKLVVSPHFQRKEKELIEELERKNNFKVTGITDSQAILEIDGKPELIE